MRDWCECTEIDRERTPLVIVDVKFDVPSLVILELHLLIPVAAALGLWKLEVLEYISELPISQGPHNYATLPRNAQLMRSK